MARTNVRAAATECAIGATLSPFGLLVGLVSSPAAAAADADALQLPTVEVTAPYEKSEYRVPGASTATKTDTPLMETPLNIQVVPQQVLLDQQVISIDQALKNVSGVTVSSGGNNGFGNAFGTVTMRGFTTDSHLRNGMRVDSFGGDTELFTQQLANVDRIEVLKGPAAILYGAVEPGGVVNVVTKQPQAVPGAYFEQQAGSYSMYRESLGATGPVGLGDALLYRIDASYLHSESILDLGLRRDLFVAPVLKFIASPDTQVTLEYEHKDANFNGNYGGTPLVQLGNGQWVPVYGEPSLNYGERSAERELTDLVGLNWSHRFDDRWSVRQQALVSVVHYTGPQMEVDGIGPLDPSQPGGPPGVYRFASPDDTHNRTLATAIDLLGHFATGAVKHTVLLGADWYKFVNTTFLSQTNPSYAPDPSVDSIISLFAPVHPGTPLAPATPLLGTTGPTDSIGAYLQDQAEMPGHLFALAGVRFQHVNQDELISFGQGPYTGLPLNDTAWTPRAGLLWRPRDWMSLYANFAENWGPSNGALESPTQLVPPTSGIQREIGAKFDLLGGRLSSTIALYDLHKTNIAEQNPANPNFYVVTGEVRSKGVELDLQGEVRPGWDVILNYSNDDAQVVSSNDPNNPVGTQWFETPRVSANLWTTYDFAPHAPRGWRIGGGVNYQGVQPPFNYTGAPVQSASDYTQIQSRTLVDLMAAYRLQVQRAKVSMQLNVTNLFNRRYFSYIFLNNPGPGTTYAYAGQTYGFDYRLYGDPRMITGSLKVEF